MLYPLYRSFTPVVSQKGGASSWAKQPGGLHQAGPQQAWEPGKIAGNNSSRGLILRKELTSAL